MMLILEKGRKALPDGTIREWHGQKFKKINGKWVMQGTGRGRGRPKKEIENKKDEPEEEPKKADPEDEPQDDTDGKPDPEKVQKFYDTMDYNESDIDDLRDAVAQYDRRIADLKKDSTDKPTLAGIEELKARREAYVQFLKELIEDKPEGDAKTIDDERDDITPRKWHTRQAKTFKDVDALEQQIEYLTDLVKYGASGPDRLSRKRQLEAFKRQWREMKMKLSTKKQGRKLSTKKQGRKKGKEKQAGEDLLASLTPEETVARSMKNMYRRLSEEREERFRDIGDRPVEEVPPDILSLLAKNGIADMDAFKALLADSGKYDVQIALNRAFAAHNDEMYRKFKSASDALYDKTSSLTDEERTLATKQYNKDYYRWQAVSIVGRIVSDAVFHNRVRMDTIAPGNMLISDLKLNSQGAVIRFETKETGSSMGELYFTPDEAVNIVSALMAGAKKEKYIMAIKGSKAYQELEVTKADSPIGKLVKEYEDELGLKITVKGLFDWVDLKKRGALKDMKKKAGDAVSETTRTAFFTECMSIFRELSPHLNLKGYVPPDGKKLGLSILAEKTEGIAGTYSEYDSTLNIMPDSKGAITHEIGHYFWYRSEELQKDFMQWAEDSGLSGKIKKNTYDPRMDSNEWKQYTDSVMSSGVSDMIDSLGQIVDLNNKLNVNDQGAQVHVDMDDVKDSLMFIGAYLSEHVKLNMGYFVPPAHRKVQAKDQYPPSSAELTAAELGSDFMFTDPSEMAQLATRIAPMMSRSETEVMSKLAQIRTVMKTLQRIQSVPNNLMHQFSKMHRNALNGGTGANYREQADYWKEPTEIFARTFRNFVSYKATGETVFQMSPEALKLQDEHTVDENNVAKWQAYTSVVGPERKHYTNTYGWGFDDVDADTAMLDYNGGELEAILKKHLGAEVVKAMVRMAMVLSKARKSAKELNINKSLTWSGHKLQGRCRVQGMDVSVENRKGSVRKGKDKDGHEWRTKMHFAYGYIRGTVGKDKDHLDCYVGPNRESEKVFVVHQNDPVSGEYDEDKVMLGFDTAEEAKAAYLKQYDRPGFFGGMDETDVETFKEKIFQKKNRGKKLIINKSRMSELALKMEEDGLYRKGMKKTWTKEQEDEGAKVEMEHTSDPDVARQIATDHLVEDSEYYTKLKEMEAK